MTSRESFFFLLHFLKMQMSKNIDMKMFEEILIQPMCVMNFTPTVLYFKVPIYIMMAGR